MTDIPTVCAWYWVQREGRTKFTEKHVRIWADMVRRNLSMPHRLAVVTNEDVRIPGLEVIRPPSDFEDVHAPWGPRKPNCYRRLSMFRRDAEKWFGDRVISMDLDCVIGGPLDPLFDRDDDFVILKGTSPDRPYNGSLQMLRTGTRPDVYELFNQKAATRAGELFVGSDQAWLALCLGWGEKTWSEKDGVFWYGPLYKSMAKKTRPRVLFFPGKLKPWVLAPIRIDPFTSENYRMMEAA